MANTPENCRIGERIMEYLKASYNKMLTHHIAGHHCHEKEGSFVNQFFMQEYSDQKKSQPVTALLNRRLETVFKLYQILLAKTQEKDKPGTKTAIIEQVQKWEKMSADLLELEA